MELEEFKDRAGKESTYRPNRRRIKIVSQTADEIIADIEYADNATENGTPINAEKMNKIRTAVMTAENNSSQAVMTAENNSSQAVMAASSANTTAGNADTKANQALETSQSAETTANQAFEKADEALTQVVNMQGTKVKVNGAIVSEFDADTKVDVSIYNTEKTALSNRVTALEAKPIITKITYDATTDTFIL